MKLDIKPATPDVASHIASLIMEAMSTDCCQNLAGPHHNLADFHRVISKLVKMDDSQYSYKNTLMGMTSSGILAGVVVAYDGADLKRLRKRFINEALVEFGIDYSGMDAETGEGEFYIDSLAVSSNFRGKKFATRLLLAAIERAKELGHSKVGLLVDKGNPLAEKLYANLGFQYVNDTVWGGHAMKHLQLKIND